MTLIKAFMLFILLTPFVSLVHAQNGASGGGARVAAAFRLRGMELINAISANPVAEKMCSARAMQAGLEGTKIRVVDILTNTETNKPIVDQRFDAWTSPGDMQLLFNAWSDFLDIKKTHDGRSVDILILHEIYRSTGICNDENFKISEGVFQLLSLPNKYSKTYNFPYLMRNVNPRSFGIKNILGSVACQQPMGSGSRFELTCVYLDDSRKLAVIFSGFFGDGNSADPLWPVPVGFISEIVLYNVKVEDFSKFNSLLGQASTKNPFIVLVDLQTGAGAYGIDPTHLNQF